MYDIYDICIIYIWYYIYAWYHVSDIINGMTGVYLWERKFALIDPCLFSVYFWERKFAQIDPCLFSVYSISVFFLDRKVAEIGPSLWLWLCLCLFLSLSLSLSLTLSLTLTEVYFWGRKVAEIDPSLWFCSTRALIILMKARGAERDELHSFIQASLFFVFFKPLFFHCFDLSYFSIISRMIFFGVHLSSRLKMGKHSQQTSRGLWCIIPTD